MWGTHTIKHWSTTQKTIALSSGEAELAGIVKGAAEGLGLTAIAQDLGFTASLEVCADSSAAIGICRRTGIGRVRHLAVAQLWVQERVRSGDFVLTKWPGERNPADILTKAVNGEIIDRHMQFVNLHWEDGRAECAPRLDGFSWDRLGPSPKAPGSKSVSTGVGAPVAGDQSEGKARRHVSWAEPVGSAQAVSDESNQCPKSASADVWAPSSSSSSRR